MITLYYGPRYNIIVVGQPYVRTIISTLHLEMLLFDLPHRVILTWSWVSLGPSKIMIVFQYVMMKLNYYDYNTPCGIFWIQSFQKTLFSHATAIEKSQKSQSSQNLCRALYTPWDGLCMYLIVLYNVLLHPTNQNVASGNSYSGVWC